jgi:pyruvate/2-oxoglutarate dehydrogenase complex dihydrolipoamide dehydrogenase (E3) component
MPRPEEYQVLILGSRKSGKSLASHLAGSGYRTAVVERRWIGGARPNVNGLPSKNELWSAKVADLVQHAAKLGLVAGPIAIDMGRVRERKRAMVRDEIAAHLDLYNASGAELIMGAGCFVAPKTLEVLERRRHARGGRQPGLPEPRDRPRDSIDRRTNRHDESFDRRNSL